MGDVAEKKLHPEAVRLAIETPFSATRIDRLITRVCDVDTAKELLTAAMRTGVSPETILDAIEEAPRRRAGPQKWRFPKLPPRH